MRATVERREVAQVTNLSPERAALAAAYLPLALRIARTWDGDRQANRSDAGWASVVAAARWPTPIPFGRYLGGTVRRTLLRSRELERRRPSQRLLGPGPVALDIGPALVDAGEILGFLKPGQDQILALKIEGYSQVEIAGQLGLSPRKVASQVRRIRSILAWRFRS